MSFEHPELLQLGAAAAGVVALAGWMHVRRRKQLALFLGGRRAVHRLSRTDLYGPRVGRVFLLMLAAIAIAGAAAGPRWQDGDAEAPGRSVVLAIDVSASMQASDASPNRLTEAVAAARGVLDALAPDRVGIVLFAGTVYPVASQTHDHAALDYLLTGVTGTMASAYDPGSLLSVAVREAAAMLAPDLAEGREGMIVLFTDGESGELEEAVVAEARAAAELGVRIHAVGVGTAAGTGMVMPRAQYQVGGPVLDADGAPATSRLNPSLLERVVEVGGGRYVHARADRALATLLDAFARAPAERPWSARHDLAGLLTALALAALLAESLLEARLSAGRARAASERVA